MVRIEELLERMVAAGASDLHLRAGSAAHARVDGALVPLDEVVLGADDTERLAIGMMPRLRSEEFLESGEADFSYAVAGIGRFRANVFRQRGTVGIVLRRVMSVVPMLNTLGVPPVVGSLAEETTGLVIVAGPTGSGKSSTLAAMVDHVNRRYPKHIITIEDPIEFLHKDLHGVITQREIGSDTASFAEAMRRAVRQDPDVIVIGEIRDMETMSAALEAAETGHLVMASLHTSTASETITRIVDLFPEARAHQVRAALAGTLRGIVCQRLVPRQDSGRVAAVEVMVTNPRIAERIMDPDRIDEIEDVIRTGSFDGMVSFDDSYAALYRSGSISADDALTLATRPHDLRIVLAEIDHERLTPPQDSKLHAEHATMER